MGDQPVGSAFIVPYMNEKLQTDKVGSVKLEGKKNKHQSKEINVKTNSNISFICWVAVSRTPTDYSPDAAYNAIWSSLLTIKIHNKEIGVSKDKNTSVIIWAPSLSKKDDKFMARQICLAIKSFLTPSIEPFDEFSASSLNKSILSQDRISTDEKEKELEGLLWSREIGMFK